MVYLCGIPNINSTYTVFIVVQSTIDLSAKGYKNEF